MLTVAQAGLLCNHQSPLIKEAGWTQVGRKKKEEDGFLPLQNP
jgi:hypothetical protein